MTLYKMTAWNLSEKLAIRGVVDKFGAACIDHTVGDATLELGPNAYCFAYTFGCAVFFNVEAPEQQRVLSILRTLLKPLEGEPITDDFEVLVDDSIAEQRVTFNRAELKDSNPIKLKMLGMVLAHSVTLEYHELVAEDLLDQAENVMRPMKHDGKLPLYSRATIRYIGISLSTRRDIVSHLYIMDEPEETWADVELDRIFKQMKLTLDIDTRFRGLEYKLKLIQEGVEVIADLTYAQRNIMLEVTIVILIVVEIVLALMAFH
jgi:uncharacterized Rmd1/YagE family protein